MEKARKKKEAQLHVASHVFTSYTTQQGYIDWLRVIGNVSLKQGLA